MTSGLAARTSCQGLAQIFEYNRPFYLRTLGGILAAVILSRWVSGEFRAWLWLAIAIALFWTCSSLAVSHYVYDRSGFYELRWLAGCLSHPPSRWIHIHAGVDEVSRTIRFIFPGSEGRVADIYDPREMTEPSIRRARCLAGVSSRAADPERLPASDGELDAAFAIFAAHELRRPETRARLFREAARILQTRGELVLVEHLRDWANFLAFGPGFLHFFPAAAWQNAAMAAGLRLRMRRRLTPFVQVFVFERP